MFQTLPELESTKARAKLFPVPIRFKPSWVRHNRWRGQFITTPIRLARPDRWTVIHKAIHAETGLKYDEILTLREYTLIQLRRLAVECYDC
jgi:hypothetical protein